MILVKLLTSKGKRMLIGGVLSALPVVLLLMPLPLSVGYDCTKTRLLIIAIACILLGLAALGAFIGISREFSDRRTGLIQLALAMLCLTPILEIITLAGLYTALILTAIGLILFGLVLGSGNKLRASGPTALLALLALLATGETALRSIPDKYLLKEVAHTPSLVLPERTREVYRQNGFRGQFPCRNCPDTIRIVSMGGSSTYGLPMFYSNRTYPAILDRMLKERRPLEKYEVLNGGIAGVGIVQVLDSLQEVIIKYKPNIVTICSWFNDSASIPGWYGVRNKSDKEVYLRNKFLLKLEKLPIYSQLRKTRLFSLFRFYVLRLKSTLITRPAKNKAHQFRPRSSPEEFRWALEQIISLGEKHNFLPVLILEPMSRSSSLNQALSQNAYYAEIFNAAKKHDLPLADPLTKMHEHKDAWLFFDFIHPNADGHRLTAEAIYESLFSEAATGRTIEFWKRLKVDPSLPMVEREPFRQFETAKLRGKTLALSVSAPFLQGQSAELELYLNNSLVSHSPGLAAKPAEFTFPLNQLSEAPPISTLTWRARLSQASPAAQTIQDEEQQKIKLKTESRASLLHIAGGIELR